MVTDNFTSFINENITLFDIIFLIFIIYFSIQCLIKGFVLSLISFLKWILALIITIKLFPIVEPYASDYIDMDKYSFVVGVAILNTSITIVFGFSILVLSNFIPTIYFGVFTGIAMLLAMIFVLTLLPKLILVVKPFGNG